MVKKVEFENNGIVHGIYALHNDFTFCTIALEDESHNSYEITDKKINCPDCIRVIKYFKSIKATEYKLPNTTRN